MGFHRVNVSFTDWQMKMLVLEANATGLKIGTIVRMLIHEDIASGRAVKHHRAAQLLSRSKNEPTIVERSLKAEE